MLLGVAAGFVVFLHFQLNVYKSKQQNQLHTDSCATPLTQSWPIQTKWNPGYIKGNNKISPAFIQFYLSFFSFYYSKLNINIKE